MTTPWPPPPAPGQGRSGWSARRVALVAGAGVVVIAAVVVTLVLVLVHVSTPPGTASTGPKPLRQVGAGRIDPPWQARTVVAVPGVCPAGQPPTTDLSDLQAPVVVTYQDGGCVSLGAALTTITGYTSAKLVPAAAGGGLTNVTVTLSPEVGRILTAYGRTHNAGGGQDLDDPSHMIAFVDGSGVAVSSPTILDGDVDLHTISFGASSGDAVTLFHKITGQ